MGRLAKTSEYRHMRERDLKLLKKPSYDIWTFPYYMRGFFGKINDLAHFWILTFNCCNIDAHSEVCDCGTLLNWYFFIVCLLYSDWRRWGWNWSELAVTKFLHFTTWKWFNQCFSTNAVRRINIFYLTNDEKRWDFCNRLHIVALQYFHKILS